MTEEEMCSSEDAGESGKREKRVFFCSVKYVCYLSYSYITKVCIFLETHLIILEAGIKILLNKETSKMGFGISCTTSHHCKSWQGDRKEMKSEGLFIIPD